QELHLLSHGRLAQAEDLGRFGDVFAARHNQERPDLLDREGRPSERVADQAPPAPDLLGLDLACPILGHRCTTLLLSGAAPAPVPIRPPPMPSPWCVRPLS